MSTKDCVLNGWRCRNAKKWYASGSPIAESVSDSDTWKTDFTSNFGSLNLPVTSSTHHSNGKVTNNMYTICIKFTTPDTGGQPITKIEIGLRVYRNSVKPTAHDGNKLYGCLRTTSASNTSDDSSNWSNTIGNEWSTDTVSSQKASAPSEVTAVFESNDVPFAPNTSYYLFLYAKDNGTSSPVVYYMYGISSSTARVYNAKAHYKAIYTINYISNGHGNAPSIHTKTEGSNLSLKTFISNQDEDSYKVSYNSNSGNTTPTTQTSTKTYKQTQWNTKKDGSGKSYTSGGTYSDNSDLTLYAIWDSGTQNPVNLSAAITKSDASTKYTISYDANGGTSTPADQTLERKKTYTFLKWAADSVSGTKYEPGSSYTPSKDITMYATWQENAPTGSISVSKAISKNDSTQPGYTVTLEPTGGSCSITSLTATDTISYEFIGWEATDGTIYKAKENYSADADTKLTAQWSSKISAYGSVNLPNPGKTGYKFQGWAEDQTAEKGVTGKYTPSKTLTLYAIWSPDGTVRIFIKPDGQAQGEFKIALVYIYNEDTEKYSLVLPYIYNNNSFQILGG